MKFSIMNIKHANILKIYAALLLTIGTFIFTIGNVSAAPISENNNGVPAYFRNQMTNVWRNGPCTVAGRDFNHAQYTWLSPASDSTIEEIRITEQDSSITAKFNMVSAHCDSAVHLQNRAGTNGTIVNQSLRQTQTRIVSASGTVNGVSTPLNGLGGGDGIRLNYNESYFFTPGARYVKRPAFSGPQPRDVPGFIQFTMSGSSIANLAPRPQPYEIRIVALARLVHQFVQPDSSIIYRCVDAPDQNGVLNLEGQINPAQAPPGSNNYCPSRTVVQTIDLYITAERDSTCEILPSTPSIVTPGQTFTGRIRVYNGGAVPNNEIWIIDTSQNNRFRLYPTGDFASPPRLDIGTESGGEIGFGVLILREGQRAISANSFVAPSTPGQYNFRWSILKENGFRLNGQEQGGITYERVECEKQITVIAPINTPFLRATGADVMSGYTFGTADRPCRQEDYDTAFPNNRSRNAPINTSGNGGYYDEPTSDFYNGSSSAQYAVLATGRIGDIDDTENVFLGNNGYSFNENNNGKTNDLLFGNTLVSSEPTDETDGQRYGYMYGSGNTATPPCLDIEPIENHPDVFDEPGASNPSFVSMMGRTQEIVRKSGDLTVQSNYQVGNGNQKILIIDGKLTINANITYQPNYVSRAGIPFLMVIAKGGIEISKDVSTVDAHLVSVPEGSSSDTGTIDTCYDIAGVPAGTWPSPGADSGFSKGSCDTHRLNVNGSLIAKKILWKRTTGSLNDSVNRVSGTPCYVGGRASGGDDNARRRSLMQLHNDCSAEWINYAPESYFGNPLVGSSASVGSRPTNTLELPPIY